ncbi:MAG: 2-amino-4-hydroxy-6-hydroxymethyldihydropteridine diphosphokinase [Lachnospiraceae bacterium]|nr:2-amino-4-hydroxy-6-hydroxymethyldihydropteridine diphosphokinase [Lachnospiraceae bacterium]
MKNYYDEIKIYDLETFANHGVLSEEKTLGQKFLISCTLYTDISKAGHTDKLKYSINYAEVCTFIDEFMRNNTYNLLEACAEKLCNTLLTHFRAVDKISLEIKKPWAPIHLPLDTVSVKIERGWHIAYIALGSNIGDSRRYFSDAIEAIDEMEECDVIKISDYITTPPYGPVEQDDFLNGCIMIRTTLSPKELLKTLNQMEANAGRTREVHWGPRTLDLDILLYDDLVMFTDNLIIPHIEMHKRDFVLKPLRQIAPYVIHPVYNKSITELFDNVCNCTK